MSGWFLENFQYYVSEKVEVKRFLFIRIVRSHNFAVDLVLACFLIFPALAMFRKARRLKSIKLFQMQWEKRIYKSLNSMCTELGVSLSLFRSASDRNDIVEKWNMLSTYSVGMCCLQLLIYVFVQETVLAVDTDHT